VSDAVLIAMFEAAKIVGGMWAVAFMAWAFWKYGE
jgi:hypothetical protein